MPMPSLARDEIGPLQTPSYLVSALLRGSDGTTRGSLRRSHGSLLLRAAGTPAAAGMKGSAALPSEVVGSQSPLDLM